MRTTFYWNTVTPLLREALEELTACTFLNTFRLVGGTALSLQLGHRESVDIDLFTDAPYGTVNFDEIDNYLRRVFSYVTDPGQGQAGIGRSYFIGNNEQECVKLDLYYTDAYIQPVVVTDTIRMASIEEIIAMKVDVVQRGGRKKDFWDLHELLDKYTPDQIIKLHKQRYPYNHDEQLIRDNLVDFSNADDDFEPICVRGKYWELIKLDIIEAMRPTS